jgi:hypothetical protein
MKRGLLFLVAFVFSLHFLSASCDLQASLINQDPYPAMPGEYVKLVFQITGAENPACKGVYFELAPEYPISFDNNSSKFQIKGNTYVANYDSSVLVPLKARLDSNALDGENQIKAIFASDENNFYATKLFNLTVENVLTDFEVYVEDYDIKTKMITFGILNTGKNDAKVVTAEIYSQENLTIKGGTTTIIGDIDSNDYSDFKYEATPKTGAIEMKLYYTDSINSRRQLEKTVYFNYDYFKGRVRDKKDYKNYFYYLAVILIIALFYFMYKRNSRKHKRN